MAEIETLYRYPVKGLSAQPLSQIDIKPGAGFTFDRFWAIENGSRDFDPENPRFFPKRRFLQLAQNPELAQLQCRFDETSKSLAIARDGVELVCGEMTDAAGVAAIEQCIAGFMTDLSGAPRLVSAEGHHFSDIPQKAVSLINLASVNEISKAAGREVSPLRFRGNIYVAGLEPWEEMNWLDKTIAIDGKPLFEVFDITGRCPATKVNLETGERDIEMLDLLSDNFGHTKCGVYLKVIDDGMIKSGDTLKVF